MNETKELIKLAAARIVRQELSKNAFGLGGILGSLALGIGLPMVATPLLSKVIPTHEEKQQQQGNLVSTNLLNRATPSSAGAEAGGLAGDIMNSILSNQQRYNQSSGSLAQLRGMQT